MKVKKRNGQIIDFEPDKIKQAIFNCFKSINHETPDLVTEHVYSDVIEELTDLELSKNLEIISVEEIQDCVEKALMIEEEYDAAKAYILYREKHKNIRDYVHNKIEFISKYKKASNTANATVDDNSNVSNRNIAVLNAEIHKSDNIQISRGMIMHKLKELYPEFNAKQYIKDLEHHIIYKHDESSFSGAIAPYCTSITLYPFILNGIKDIGGLSAAPKNLDSFCGMYVNMLFAVASQFAGAVAVSEFLPFFIWYCKKEWGEDFWKNPDKEISIGTQRKKTIRSQIHQYWQQIIYSLNQPAAARGNQSIFYNQSYFDKLFFEGMFNNFYFPDGTQPDWESLDWTQREFMQWFNQERLKCILTFPVESFALIYKDGKFQDEETAKFVAEEYARGHSFFTYISDTADSLSSCCRLKNKVQTKEFNFTNGNLGIETGSKSVITLNLSRIIQDFCKTLVKLKFNISPNLQDLYDHNFSKYLNEILERILKYHIAYNELLWDMYDANLLTVYKAGFIHLDKQYLTYGINGLNQSAEYLGLKCTNNEEYKKFCKTIFGLISHFCDSHKGEYFGHKITLNVEQVPAESLSIKNLRWDKEDGYWTPDDTNLYASYVFKPNDPSVSVLDKFIMHSKQFASDELSGGQAAHINLDSHLSYEQYWKLLNFAGNVGCSYFTFNIPNCECDDCGFIAKQPFDKCPKCGSSHNSLWDRIIGYLTKIKNWSEGRQIEQKTRIYSKEV